MDPRTRARSRRRLAIPLLLAIALAAEASGAALAVPRHVPTGGGLTAAPGAFAGSISKSRRLAWKYVSMSS